MGSFGIVGQSTNFRQRQKIAKICIIVAIFRQDLTKKAKNRQLFKPCVIYNNDEPPGSVYWSTALRLTALEFIWDSAPDWLFSDPSTNQIRR